MMLKMELGGGVVLSVKITTATLFNIIDVFSNDFGLFAH